MIQNLSFSPVRNIVPANSKFLPTPQTSAGNDFRDVLASNKTSNIYTALTSGSQRDKLIDAINQARMFTPNAFKPAAAQAREPFNIQNHYTMPPEEVKPILEKLEEEIRNTDFSGMSNAQIYGFIENKYIEEFGNEFMMGHHILMVVPGSGMWNNPDRPMSNYEYVDIGFSFKDMVSSELGYMEMLQTNRTRLYGDKSDGEVIDAIIAKYPQGKTNRDLVLIEGELQSVGINFHSVGRLVDTLIIKSDEMPWDDNYPSWSDFEDRWNNIMNARANVQQLAFMHNASLKEARTNPLVAESVMQTRDILVKLGAELGPDGYFLNPDKSIFVSLDVEFGAGDSDALFDGFLKDLEQHHKNLDESRERLEKNRYTREVLGVYESASDNYHNGFETKSTDVTL